MLSVSHNFLFIHIPKTAGNSLQSILLNYSDDKKVVNDGQDGKNRFGITSEEYRTVKHSSLQNYQNKLPQKIFNQLFKFTCIRNPWDRLISFYYSPHRGVTEWCREDFIQFVKTTPSMLDYLEIETGLSEKQINIDFFIRFESLENDFAEVCKILNIPFTELPVLNKSNRNNYMDYYDKELIKLVYDIFHKEIDLFNYSYS